MLLLQPWGLIFRLLDRLLKHSEDVYVRNLTMIDCKSSRRMHLLHLPNVPFRFQERQENNISYSIDVTESGIVFCSGLCIYIRTLSLYTDKERILSLPVVCSSLCGHIPST